jgi:hypothetical protein
MVLYGRPSRLFHAFIWAAALIPSISSSDYTIVSWAHLIIDKQGKIPQTPSLGKVRFYQSDNLSPPVYRCNRGITRFPTLHHRILVLSNDNNLDAFSWVNRHDCISRQSQVIFWPMIVIISDILGYCLDKYSPIFTSTPSHWDPDP